MPFSALQKLEREAPLRILLVDAAGTLSLSMAGLLEPLRLTARLLGPERLQVDVIRLDQMLAGASASGAPFHMTLLVADAHNLPPTAHGAHELLARCRDSPIWGAVGHAVLWLAKLGEMRGLRTALPWNLYAEVNDTAEMALLSPNLFELDANRISCCGGTAAIDLALTMIDAIWGKNVQAAVMETLCIDRARGAGERQRVALQARFGKLQPKLSEAVALMEANIEEPLTTDDIANLVGISRRQLERQFKQFLGIVPSRYYLELRLQKARQLVLQSNHSIVQVGLICGFSSSSHFSTAYSALFGLAPRDERQKMLARQMA